MDYIKILAKSLLTVQEQETGYDLMFLLVYNSSHLKYCMLFHEFMKNFLYLFLYLFMKVVKHNMQSLNMLTHLMV